MEDEYNDTVPVDDDTFVVESSNAESSFLNLDMDTEVVDVAESSPCKDEMKGDLENEVVLDTDDEGEGNGKDDYVPVIGRFSGSSSIRLKQRKVSAGCLQRQGNKVSGHPDPAKSVECREESNAWRSFLYDDKVEEQHDVVGSVRSNSPDPKSVFTKAAEFHVDAGYLNMAREYLPGQDNRKLSSHGSKSMNVVWGANSYSESAEHSHIESPEAPESHDKVLEFVDHYLSSCDLVFNKDEETRKCNRITSPPPLWSKGSQCLAWRINRGFGNCKIMSYDWDPKQIEKNEYPFLKKKDSSVHLSSDHHSLEREKTLNVQSENFPVKLSDANDLDATSVNYKDNKIGLFSGACVEYTLVESNELLVEGSSRQNLEVSEECDVAPDSLDIGLDTQIAAEAMEALWHSTPILDSGFDHPGSDNDVLECSKAPHKDAKPNDVNHPEEAFTGWRCKQKRSRSTRIFPVQFPKQHFSAINHSVVPRRRAGHFPVSKKLMTENLRAMTGVRNTERSEHTGKGNGRGLQEITLKKQESFEERDGLKDFQKHQSLYDRKSKDVTELEFPQKRRKVICLHDAGCNEIVHVNCLKSNSGLPVRMKTSSTKRYDLYNRNVVDRTLSKPNLWWTHPKRKRTRQCDPSHFNRSRIMRSPLAAIENCSEKHCRGNEGARKMDKGLLVYTRRRKSSSDSCSPLVHEKSFSNSEVNISMHCTTPKPSDQSVKLGLGVVEMISDKGSSEHSMELQVHEGCDKIKRQCNYEFKSPLMKELSRLGYTESPPDFLPKASRRRRTKGEVCVLFSKNLNPGILKQQKKIVSKFGLSIASCCADATHFIAGGFFRTGNMLEAIALGKPVVTPLWLESCEQAGFVVDEKNYILRDEKKEKELGFNMLVSLARANQNPLLKGRTVLMTPNVKPSLDVIRGLVKAVHGQVVLLSTVNARLDQNIFPDSLLILSCEEDYKICLPLLEKGASIYESELLLSGIITQKLEYERFELFKEETAK